jgi:hypothetical protein
MPEKKLQNLADFEGLNSGTAKISCQMRGSKSTF